MSALSERQKWLIAAALAVAWGIGLFLLADNHDGALREQSARSEAHPEARARLMRGRAPHA